MRYLYTLLLLTLISCTKQTNISGVKSDISTNCGKYNYCEEAIEYTSINIQTYVRRVNNLYVIDLTFSSKCNVDVNVTITWKDDTQQSFSYIAKMPANTQVYSEQTNINSYIFSSTFDVKITTAVPVSNVYNVFTF